MSNNPASKIHEKLFKNITDKGSSGLISPCMGCVTTFKTAANIWNSKSENKIEVFELTELVNRSMGIHIPRKGLNIDEMLKFLPGI